MVTVTAGRLVRLCAAAVCFTQCGTRVAHAQSPTNDGYVAAGARGQCYRGYTQLVGNARAAQLCASDNARLANFVDEPEYRAVLKLAGSPQSYVGDVWIDGSKYGAQWRFGDGTAFNRFVAASWRPSNPDNPYVVDRGTCLAIRQENGKDGMWDKNCAHIKRFVCVKKCQEARDPQPDGVDEPAYKSGYAPAGNRGMCYRFISNGFGQWKTKSQAAGQCKQDGSTLASIADRAEYGALVAMYNKASPGLSAFWLDGRKDAGQWHYGAEAGTAWNDTLHDSLWTLGHPINLANFDCMQLGASGKLLSANCNAIQLGTLCMYKCE